MNAEKKRVSESILDTLISLGNIKNEGQNNLVAQSLVKRQIFFISFFIENVIMTQPNNVQSLQNYKSLLIYV